MGMILASIRLVIASLAICVALYAGAVWGVGRLFLPESADGSLIVAADGHIAGSRLIAQKFTEARYFWPRPSAVDYNGAGAGGSNKSPTSPDLTKRGEEIVAAHGATMARPLPAELATASGGGLDPHITEHAALWQAGRVAAARGMPPAAVEQLIRQHAVAPGGLLTPDRLVNVLELNLALDAAR
jgi:K+-transporting ATPase ATPase C chain